jgi:hypothetical protein
MYIGIANRRGNRTSCRGGPVLCWLLSESLKASAISQLLPLQIWVHLERSPRNASSCPASSISMRRGQNSRHLWAAPRRPIPNCLRQLANLSKIRIVSQRAVGTEQANGTVNWEPVTSGFHHHAEFLGRSGKRGRQVIPNAASRLCILLSRQSLTRTYINVSIRLVGSLEVYTFFPNERFGDS